MALKAISRFHWRNHTYEIGDEVICPEKVVAERLMAEGNIESVTALNVPAATKPINPPTGKAEGAEMPSAKLVVAKKQVAKKKKK